METSLFCWQLTRSLMYIDGRYQLQNHYLVNQPHATMIIANKNVSVLMYQNICLTTVY